MRVLSVVFELLLILGGVIACSGLIVAKKPDARAILEKLVPFQAMIGILMIIMGVVFLIAIGPIAAFKAISANPLPAAANLVGILIAIILGFLFALPQIISMAPGQEQRARELAEKIIPFQILLGLGAAACGLIGLLYTLGVMKLAGKVGLAP